MDKAGQVIREWLCPDAPGIVVEATCRDEAATAIERVCAGVWDLAEDFAARVAVCQCDRVPVLCGCGWGSLGVPECEVPENCPVCGFDFWERFGAPDPCRGVS